MSKPYTVNDTPAIVQRIEHDLAIVLAALRRSDPGLRSVVLTGGFGRGEGAVLNGEPQNDYDFVVFRNPLKRATTSYSELRKELEKTLRIHIDLAPVSTLRVRYLRPSIFWYETALRGRILWGEDHLRRIRIRSPDKLDQTEGLRMLVNRAAGLLLSSETKDPHLRRIQASKAILAAADAHLLARGIFPPTQTERHAKLTELYASDAPPVGLDQEWTEWAYHYKVDPTTAPAVDPHEAWRRGARLILNAVPVAVNSAGLPSLEDYARRDGLIDHLVYFVRASRAPGMRFALNPTGRVRVGTLELLASSLDGHVNKEAAKRAFGPLARHYDEPIRTLDRLRTATLQ